MKKYIRFILAGVLVAVAIFIMVLIKNGGIVNFDNEVYRIVTSNMNDTFTNIYKVFTFLGSTIFIVGACLAILVLMKNKKKAGVIVGSVAISTVVNQVIKNVFRRERPLVLRLVEEKSFSFPSGHTMAATALYGILVYFVMKSNMRRGLKITLSVVLALLPFCVAVSRIYLGVHYTSDVIAGFLIAISYLVLYINIINSIIVNKNFKR